MHKFYLEAEIAPVLYKHRVKSARELNERLEQTRKPERIEVRDIRNRDRLLGTIMKPQMGRGHTHFRMATMSRISAVMYPTDPVSMLSTIDHIELRVETVFDSPLDPRAVFVTDASLNNLMRVRDFRLPGENEEQAHVRQMYAD